MTLLTWTQDLITERVRPARSSPAPSNASPIRRPRQLRQQDSLITIQRLGVGRRADASTTPTGCGSCCSATTASRSTQTASSSPRPTTAWWSASALRAFIPDAQHAILAAVLVGNAALDELAVGSDAVTTAFDGRTFDNATVTITGTPTFLTDINDYLQGGMLTLGGIAVLVMIVILIVAFRVRWRLLPLLGMVVGVAWGFGAFGFTGSEPVARHHRRAARS